jgi:hypothetical protein
MNRTFSRAGSYPLHSSDWPAAMAIAPETMMSLSCESIPEDRHSDVGPIEPPPSHNSGELIPMLGNRDPFPHRHGRVKAPATCGRA